MSKKILSMALAVIMLISVFAFSASAANTTVTTTFPTAGKAGYRVVSDAYVGMPRDSIVTVKVYWVLPYGADRPSLMSTGKLLLAYNGAKYKINTANEGNTSQCFDAMTIGASYTSLFNSESAVNTGTTVANSTLTDAKLTEVEKTYGWTKTVLASYDLLPTAGTKPAQGFAYDYDCEIISLSFTALDTITANDVIGIPDTTLGSMTTIQSSNGTSLVRYAKNVVNSEPAVPTVSSVNETSGAKFRMSEDEGKVDLGITGTVKSVSLNPGKTFKNGRYVAANLTAVGVQARVDGVVAAAEDGYVYETSDGYQFRAAITGMDAAGLSKDIDVRTYITDNAGNTYFSNWMNIDAKTAHNASVSASGGKFAGIL